MTLTTPIVSIVAASVALFFWLPGGYLLPSFWQDDSTSFRDEPLVGTPVAYLLTVFVGCIHGLWVGLLLSGWMKTSSALMPVLAGGGAGVVGTILGIAIRAFVNKKEREAQK